MTFSSAQSTSFRAVKSAPLSPTNFAFLREMLRREVAISLDDGKEYLVETRLSSIARNEGLDGTNALLERCRSSGCTSGAIKDQIIDALTTNETLFFRDMHPFEALRTEVLPEMRERLAPRRSLSVWSAACSTGQEPYSLAMLLADSFPEFGTWRINILGTDISKSALERARDGVYQQFEVNRGMPAKMLVQFFEQNAGLWRVKDSIRRNVRFEQRNLIQPWSGLGPFDIIFMRNVLIYFEVDVRREILRRVKSVLAPGGYLILGNAETAVTLDRDYQPVKRGRATFFQSVS